MKILHICKWDKGGAYNAALGLHKGLKQNGLDSKILKLDCTSSDIDVVQFNPKRPGIFKHISSKIRNKLIRLEFKAYKNSWPYGFNIFIDARTVFEISKHPLVKEADVINLHWVGKMIDYPEFFKHTLNKPIVMTLHDMHLFTGGCCHSGACVKYRTGCGACPQLGSRNPNDLSRKIFKIKQKAYLNHNISITCVSNWLRDCARESPLFKDFRIETCHCDTSTDIFRKHDKRYVRGLLGLPQDKIIILFGADYFVESKGLKYLVQSLPLLKDKIHPQEVLLATFGPKQSGLSDYLKDKTFPIQELGYINSRELLSQVYSAADIFVIPSLEESLAQTCLEAMSCGTPVIGFNVGGIPEMIISGKTGLLVKAGNSAELAQGIEWMISHSQERAKMAENGRRLIEEEYAFPIQAKRYVKIYETILRK